MMIYSEIAISLALSWILWHRLREIRLVADLDKMSGDLFDIALALGRLEDPAFIQARQVVIAIASERSFLSLPIILRNMWTQSGVTPRIESEDPEFEACLMKFCENFNRRLMTYILRESVFSLTLGAIVTLWPFDDGKNKDRNPTMTSAFVSQHMKIA